MKYTLAFIAMVVVGVVYIIVVETGAVALLAADVFIPSGARKQL